MSEKYTIEVGNSWQLDGSEWRCATVYKTREGAKRREKWIQVVGKDDAEMYHGLKLWAEKGCPSGAELKDTMGGEGL